MYFELRTYIAAPGKLEDLQQQIRAMEGQNSSDS